MDDAGTIHVTVNVTIAILPLWNSAPEADGIAPAGDMHAESRTRQRHAADDPAGTPAADK